MSGVNVVIAELQTVQRGVKRRTRVVTYPTLDATEAEEAATECRTRPVEPGQLQPTLWEGFDPHVHAMSSRLYWASTNPFSGEGSPTSMIICNVPGRDFRG